jgi:magnesium transporter
MATFASDPGTALPASEAPHPQSVEHYLVKAVPTARPAEPAGAVRARLTEVRYDDASHLFVVAEDHRLVGVADIGDVMAAPAARPVGELASAANAHVVMPTTDREEAASAAIRAGVSALGVCGADGRFVGAVPASALISILRDEHLEDLHHMAGILGKSEAAKAALFAPPHRRALYRLPWLLVGMAGSALATAMMTRFEAALAAHIAVAFFIPAIVYLADAVGTQSEAVAVRGLSLSGGALTPLLAGELGTGVLIGVTLGLLAYPLVWLVFGSAALAATVAVALIVASSLATSIGLLLPWTFARLGYDPVPELGHPGQTRRVTGAPDQEPVLLVDLSEVLLQALKVVRVFRHDRVLRTFGVNRRNG